MNGLLVGAGCPHILHTHPLPRLCVQTKLNRTIDNTGIRGWDAIDYLFCRLCGTRYHAAQKDQKVMNIVLSTMDPNLRLTVRLANTDFTTSEFDPLSNPTCRGCGGTKFHVIQPELTIDYLKDGQKISHAYVLRALLHRYHYCTQCLMVFEQKPYASMMSQRGFEQILEHVRKITSLEQTATTPEELLEQLLKR